MAGGNGTVIRFVFFTLKRFMKVSGTGIVQMSHEKGIATGLLMSWSTNLREGLA